MLNNVKENEVDLYLQTEKKAYWKDRLHCFRILLVTTFLTCFCLFGMCVTIWMIVNKPEILLKYIVSTVMIFGLIALLSYVIYKMLGYKYFFKKRHRTRFYRKYMDRFLLAFFLTIVIVIALIVMNRYVEHYWLLGFTFTPMLFVFILPKYKKLKSLYPPLEDLSLYHAIYIEKFIETHEKSLWFQFPLLTEQIQEIAIIYYYLNIVLYDSDNEPIPLSDDNLKEKVREVAKQHIKNHHNENLYNEIEARAFKLKLRNDNFINVLDDFFA